MASFLACDWTDQLTINEYPPGVGIAPHVDTHTGNVVCMWSMRVACACYSTLRYEPHTHVPICKHIHNHMHISAQTSHHMPAFEDGIACVSLGSDIVIDFRHPHRQSDFHAARWAPRRSLLVMTGPTRNGRCTHPTHPYS